MTPKQIQAIRHTLEENTATFGERFCVSGRTVENWEQGHRTPHPLVVAQLEKLYKRLRRQGDIEDQE